MASSDTDDPHDDAQDPRARCGDRRIGDAAGGASLVAQAAERDDLWKSLPLGSRIAARFAAAGGLPHDLPELHWPASLLGFRPPWRHTRGKSSDCPSSPGAGRDAG